MSTPIATPRTAAIANPARIPTTVVLRASASWPLEITSPNALSTDVGGARKKSPSCEPAYCHTARTTTRIASWVKRSQESRLRRSTVARDSSRRSTAMAI